MKHLNTKIFNKLIVVLITAAALFLTTKIHAQNDLWCMEFFDDVTGITMGDSGTIKQTFDGGSSWTIKTSGTSSTLKKSNILANDDIVVVGLNGTIIKSTDYGDTWNSQSSGTIRDLYGVSFSGRNSNVGIAVGSNSIVIRTTDVGNSWSQVSSLDTSSTRPKFAAVSLASENKGILVGDGGTIFITDNGGLNWSMCPSSVPNVNYKFVIMLSEDIAYATGDNGIIIKTTDGGASWITLNTNSTSTLYRIRFADDQIAISVGTNGEVIKTTDGGLTWNTETSGTANNLNCLFMYDENLAYTGGQNGIILKTIDGGASWSSQSGNYMLRGPHRKKTVIVKKDENVKLFPNYPNPSNPTTTIKYYIASASVVTLKIYDAIGKEVRTLVSQSLSAGMYSTLFDGTNLPSGVYYCKLVVQSNTGIFNQTTKIVLVK